MCSSEWMLAFVQNHYCFPCSYFKKWIPNLFTTYPLLSSPFSKLVLLRKVMGFFLCLFILLILSHWFLNQTYSHTSLKGFFSVTNLTSRVKKEIVLYLFSFDVITGNQDSSWQILLLMHNTELNQSFSRLFGSTVLRIGRKEKHVT